MSRNTLILCAALGALPALLAHAQARPPSAPLGTNLHPVAPVSTRTVTDKIAAAPHADALVPEETSASVPEASAQQRLLTLVLAQQMEQAKEAARQNQALREKIKAITPSITDKIVTVGIALGSALVGALSAYLLQRQRLRHDEKTAQRAAGIKELSEIKQFRGRQLNEFYAPLEALLKQGLVVRDEFYAYLLATTLPTIRFKRVPDEIATNGWSLSVSQGQAEARPFRLLVDLPMIQESFPDVMSTVGELVRINGQIVKLIHKKVGFVLHENTELSRQLGTFLAHQSVLDEMYKAVKDGRAVSVPTYSTTFPRSLQRLVIDDCNLLRTELSEWERNVARWVKEMSPAKVV